MNRLFSQIADGLIFNVYLTPGASKTCINGLRYEDAGSISIKISVHGKPVENQANIDLIKFISDTFDLPKSRIKILSGQKSRYKRIMLYGYSITDMPNQIRDLLTQELSVLPKTLF